MATATSVQRRFAFVFPMASGHINPSLPIARALVAQGHEVHFQSREQMRAAIQDTGATFYDEIKNMPELYQEREPDLFGAMESLKREFGLEDDDMLTSMMKLRPINMELMVPGALRFLQQVKADVLVCCPLMNGDAVQAAKILEIPIVSLLTTAGPGSMAKALQEMVQMNGQSVEELQEITKLFAPGNASRKRYEEMYGVKLRADDGLEPIGVMDAIIDSTLTLITTCQDLQDPSTREMDEAYAGATFETVGPLLDVQGAVRAAGHKFQGHQPVHVIGSDPLGRLRKARAANRRVVLVSMGTVITGDSADWGWHVKPRAGATGERQGFSGRELCQAAWAGAFDAFGAFGDDADLAPLLLVALGPQAEALGNLKVPDNALCLPVLPQVDLLKVGVDIFLTHGGQNSFTESLSQGVPMVICPGFADQPVNARKAVDMGVGLQVERLVPSDGEEAEAAEAYRNSVRAALLEVDAEPRFAAAASGCAARLRAAGGVPRAVELILGVAGGAGENSSCCPTLLTSRTSAATIPQKRTDSTLGHAADFTLSTK